ncbi:hypothetical protein K2X33_04585, partial [bacterium]|nr:hypothetical protein [bacterium]
IMIARAATARPWILWQIAYQQGLTTERPPLSAEEEGQEYFSALLRLTCLLEDYFGDNPATIKKMIFYLAISSRWMLFGHDFLTRVRRLPTLWQIRDFINEYRERALQPMIGRART